MATSGWAWTAALGWSSGLVLVPCRRPDRVGVVDDVEAGDLVAAWCEGEEVHHLERDEGSVPDGPVVPEIRGGVILACVAQEDVAWRDDVLGSCSGETVKERACGHVTEKGRLHPSAGREEAFHRAVVASAEGVHVCLEHANVGVHR